MKQALIGASLGMLALGLFAPRTAIRSAHALVALIAIGLLIVLIQPAISAWEVARASPFAPVECESPRSIAPAVIGEIADDLNRPGGALSAKTKGRIGSIAVGRLLAHHAAPTSIAPDELHRFVSPTLASIIAPSDGDRRIGVGELDSILTELEEL